jgi:hypothetical protein
MTAGRSFAQTGPARTSAATSAAPATPGKATLTQQLVLRGLTKEEVLAMIEAATRDGASAPAAIAARSPYGAAAKIHTGPAAAALTEAADKPVVVVDEHVVVAASLDPQSQAGEAAIAAAVSTGPGPAVSKTDADAALMISMSHMMAYGRVVQSIGVPPALAAPIASIASACGSTETAPEARRRLLDQGVAGLAQARAVARPDLVTQFSSELAVVHRHLEDELAAGGAGTDSLTTMMQTRAALGRAGGVAIEMKKLVTFANAKRLAAARKAVDWTAFGEIIAKNAQLVPSDSPELKEAFGALEGASFEMGFQLLDAALTAAAAGKTIGDNPDWQHDPVKQAKVSKAVIDLSVAVLNGCMITGRAVAVASMELCDGDEHAMWGQLAADLGKGVKLVGGTFSVLTAAVDIAANAVILWNGAEGIDAADAWAAIAGSGAAILAEGTKLLLEVGIIAPAEGMFAGFTAGALAAEIVAIAAPLAVAIPLAWIGTKILLLELGKLRIGITGALMAQAFDHLIEDAEALARETEVLGVALGGALDPTADPEVVKTALAGRVDLVRARVETMRHRAVNQRAMVIKREVTKLCASTGVLDGYDPLAVAAGARATVVGVMAILERSPELVAEEAGDPSLVDRARNGAPDPQPGPM